MHIFLDLDGTLIDFSQRLYRLYCDLMEQAGYDVLPMEDYWPLKQNDTHEREIIARTGAADFAKDYLAGRSKGIEHPDYLAYDTIIPGVPELLTDWQKDHTLSLVTLRSDREALEAQLNALDLRRYFTHVQSGFRNGAGREDSKTAMIREIWDGDGTGIMVGDTDADIVGGRNAGAVTVAVESGVRGADWLADFHFDYLVPDLTHLPDILPRIANHHA